MKIAENRSIWKTVRFGDVVREVKETEREPLEKGLDRYIGLEHLDPESIKIKRWGLIAEDNPSFTRRFRKGQMLFARRRAYQRKAGLAEFDGICSGDIIVMEAKPDRLLPDLLPFLIHSDPFFEYAMRTSAGSLSPRTKWSHLAKYEFALPPLDEQRRVAEILWAAEETIRKYELVAQSLEKSQQVVAGHLLSRSNSLSQGKWVDANINELGGSNGPVLKTGPFGSSFKQNYFVEQNSAMDSVPVLNIAALGEIELEHEGLTYLNKQYAEKFEAYTVAPNDIVFSRVADVGRCILIPEESNGWIISSNVIRIRLDPSKVIPAFFLYLLRYSFDIKKQIIQITATGGRLLVNTQTLQELVFPMPPLNLQRKRVDTIFTLEKRALDVNAHLEKLQQTASVTRKYLLSSRGC